MKKLLFWSAVATIAAISCSKIENDTDTDISSGISSFTAFVDGAPVRTLIDGMKSYWNGTERIWVLNGSGSSKDWKKAYTVTATKQESATFVEEDKTSTLTGDDYLAIYPAGPATSATWDGNVANPAKKLWLKNEQMSTPGSYDPESHIALAYTTKGNNNLEFKNVTALVKFTLKTDKVSEIYFYGNGEEVIAGNFDVTYNNGEPTCKTTTGGYVTCTNVRLAPSTGNLAKDKTYYVSVLPGTFNNGFSIEMIVDGIKAIKKVSSKYVLERNEILDLGNLNVSDSGWKKILYLHGNSSYWHQAYAKFDAWIWGGSVSGQWADFTYDGNESDQYSVMVPWCITSLNIYRRNPDNSQNHNHDNYWNAAKNITLNGNNCINITDWDKYNLSKQR